MPWERPRSERKHRRNGRGWRECPTAIFRVRRRPFLYCRTNSTLRLRLRPSSLPFEARGAYGPAPKAWSPTAAQQLDDFLERGVAQHGFRTTLAGTSIGLHWKCGRRGMLPSAISPRFTSVEARRPRRSMPRRKGSVFYRVLLCLILAVVDAAFCAESVSYTHLDVYKRQSITCVRRWTGFWRRPFPM